MKKNAIIRMNTKICGLSILCCGLLTGCNTDELCYSHPHDGEVSINIDWRMADSSECEGVRVWFYPTGGEEGIPYDISRSGGVVRVLEGEYHLLAHNNDTEWILYSGQEDFQNHSFTTRDADILEPILGRMSRADDDSLLPVAGERVAVAPEPVYAAKYEDFNSKDNDNVELLMEYRHCSYTFEFKDTGSLKNVSKMSAAISGMAESVGIVNGQPSVATVTLPVNAYPGKDDNSITGSFYSFGDSDASSASHRMALYLVMTNGKQYKFVKGDNLDVTSQIHNSSDKRNVHIVINGLKIPEVEATGEGEEMGNWDVGLDDWEESNIDIKV